MKPPKIGTTFLHAKWLNPDYKTPLTCVVTAIRKGRIYYKHRGGRMSFEYCTAERWSFICKEVVTL